MSIHPSSQPAADNPSRPRRWRRFALAATLLAGGLLPATAAAPPASASIAGCLAGDVVGIASRPSGKGYWLAGADGGVFGFGDARFVGSMAGRPLNKPIVSIVSTPSGGGYWLVGADGGVFAFGDAVAPSWNPLPGTTLNAPVVGAARIGTTGLELVAADGGVFALGNAPFYGSMGGKPLNRPVVGVVPTASGAGYWLVAADGGIFAFGDAVAPADNPLPGLTLNAPIVGATRTGTTGLDLVAADGGVFSLGGAQNYGTASGLALAKPISGIAAGGAAGYWLTGRDGGLFGYGTTAGYYGNATSAPGCTTSPAPAATVANAIVQVATAIKDGKPVTNWAGGAVPYSWGGGHVEARFGPSKGNCGTYHGSVKPCPASSTTGVDCSGFVRWVYAIAYGSDVLGSGGTTQQITKVHKVTDPRPGDLVFFGRSLGSSEHVGIYIGNGQMIDAYATGTYVRIDKVSAVKNLLGYWRY